MSAAADGAAPRALRSAIGGAARRAASSPALRRPLRSSAERIARQGLLPSTTSPASRSAALEADGGYGRSATPGWREIDWSRHIHDLEVDGRSVRYADLGAGEAPPVIFVHGLGGNWQNWLENMPRIAQERRVLALDLPGFGESELPPWEISISAYARAVDGWLDRLGVGHVAVVGNSMGGFIAAELAIQCPERVERLALAAAAGISITNLKRRPTMTVARLAVALGSLVASRSREIIARERLRHLVVAPVVRHPSRIRPDLLYEIMQGSGKPAYFASLDALTSYDFRDRLPEIRCPTLVVWGRDDVLVPVGDAAEFERLIPHSRRVVMDDTGHVPMLERPEAFNRHLSDFLAEPASPAASSRWDGDAAARPRRREPAPDAQ